MSNAIKIYHIIHWDKLQSVIRDGGLYCDAVMSGQHSVVGTTIGHTEIKDRRRAKGIYCCKDLKVSDCVPFYFCPRSVMLYRISCGEKSGLEYQGGEAPIVHLEIDMNALIAWATANNRQWAFSDRNAACEYVAFYNQLEKLTRVKWDYVFLDDWRERSVKEAKQAEFLVERFCPWHLVERIGVHNNQILQQVKETLKSISVPLPKLEVRSDWYYTTGRRIS